MVFNFCPFLSSDFFLVSLSLLSVCRLLTCLSKHFVDGFQTLCREGVCSSKRPVTYPSLWQQEVEMWLCRLPVLMDALTSVSQHCEKGRGGILVSQCDFFFFFFHHTWGNNQSQQHINKTLGSREKPRIVSFREQIYSARLLVKAANRIKSKLAAN